MIRMKGFAAVHVNFHTGAVEDFPGRGRFGSNGPGQAGSRDLDNGVTVDHFLGSIGCGFVGGVPGRLGGTWGGG